MKKQVRKINGTILKTWLLALGCLSGTMLHAGEDSSSEDDDSYLSLEDWYKLKDWKKASSFGALSEEDQESIEPQLDNKLKQAIAARAFRDEPEMGRLRIWRRLKRETKVDPELEALLFGGLSKRDQLRVWKQSNSTERALYFKHLNNSLRQQLFPALDEAARRQYLEHRQPQKVHFQEDLPGYQY